MDNWDAFVNQQYEEYMLQNCTCDRSEDCNALDFRQFESRLLKEIEEERGEAAYLELACPL